MLFEWRALIDRLFHGRAMVSYLIALLAALLAAAVRFGLEPWLAGRAHYLVFVVAVFVAAMFGGTLPAIFAALMSYFFVYLLDQATLDAPSGPVELATFIGACTIVIWLVHLVVRWRHQSVLDEVQARLREEGATRLAEDHDLLIDHLHGHGVLMLDPEGRIRIWSKGAEKLFGRQEADVLGQSGELLYAPEAIAAGQPAADHARARAEGGFVERTQRVRQDGTPVAVEIDWSALHDPRGRLRGYAQLIRAIDG